MILLVKLYAQFHPSRELELRAVVETKIRIPVRAVLGIKFGCVSQNKSKAKPVDIASVPRLPMIGRSTMYPARSAPGNPMILRITC